MLTKRRGGTILAPMTRARLAIPAPDWRTPPMNRLARWLHCRWQRGRQRRHLSELSDHQLRDLGLTPDDVREKLIRPPWR